MVLTGFDYTDRFKRDLASLDPQTQAAVKDCLGKMLNCRLPNALRHHTLNAFKPKIHKVDVTPNRAYQITFEVDGSVAKLLRVGTHKQIDRSPK